MKIKEVYEFIKLLEKQKLSEYINIPRICSIGNQSNGKTSILTNIIGLDILPKGDGVVTRRPLELRLNKINSGKPYIYFGEDKKDIITDFQCIKDKINKLTEATCGKNKNIKDDPLIINIFSQTCPNLTIIDLPGITRVPVGDQPKNIEEITKEMTLRYINDPYTIILCAIDVNQDISTSDGLYLAKEVDYYGERTLGVLTKIDLMDKGTDCKEILLNKLIPLKLGYIAVKNRSKLDLINNVSIKNGLEKERLFFENNENYNKLDKKLIGT
jgi:dynamin 1-like protein